MDPDLQIGTLAGLTGRLALIYGSEGWGSSPSERAGPGQSPLAIVKQPLLLPKSVTSHSEQLIDGVGRLLA